MPAAARKSGEWIDGFLFVANQPVLDFLNTKPVLKDGPTELLADFHALERWLIAAGMAGSAKAKARLRSWRRSAEGAAFLKELIGFRERLREAVQRVEDGQTPSDGFLKEINARLARYPLQVALRRRDGRLAREAVFDPGKPSDFWAPLMDAAVALFSETDPSRIRQCTQCVVHFFDVSKKGSRRWCSMKLCGNKQKVAAYQRRRREAAEES